MGKMRTMTHNSRTNAKGRVHGAKHNDRNFDTSKADNIVQEREELNRYWHLYQGEKMTFEEAEIRFYKEKFSGVLEKTNEAYVKNGHPERCKTMEEWKSLRRHCPEETTLQIGKMEESVSLDELTMVHRDYLNKLNTWNREHGNPFTILDIAIHADEAVPHIQTRRVWHYQDDSGILKIGQEKALEQAGVGLPNPEKPEGRRNNRKMAFDAMCRQWWIDACYARGIEVEREALPDSKTKKSLDKEDMIREKYQDILNKTEELKTHHEIYVDAIEEAQNMHSECIEEINSASQELQEIRDEVSVLEERENALKAKIQDMSERELPSLMEKISEAETDYKKKTRVLNTINAALKEGIDEGVQRYGSRDAFLREISEIKQRDRFKRLGERFEQFLRENPYIEGIYRKWAREKGYEVQKPMSRNNEPKR